MLGAYDYQLPPIKPTRYETASLSHTGYSYGFMPTNGIVHSKIKSKIVKSKEMNIASSN